MKAYRQERTSASGQYGFALLEALISILVFSFGILSLVGMQSLAVKSSIDAKYRADAAYLANQIIGKIWTDRSSISSYSHLPTGTPCSPGGSASSYAGVTDWLTEVSRSLPGAGSTLQQIIVDTTNNRVTVNVCWRTATDAIAHTYSAVAQIN